MAQFQLLAPERQLTLEGRAEPLPESDGFHSLADAAEPQDAYAAQAELFGWPQAELPIHPLVDGQIHPDCVRGYRAKADAHARDDGSAVHVVPECCGFSGCQCSQGSNDAERAKDMWNGTQRRAGRVTWHSELRRPKGERIGLRHVAGEADLAVLVVTLPPGKRPAAREAKAKLKAWERAACRAVQEVLRAHVGCADARFYVRANIHPCGENAQQWKPHLNFMLPSWYFSPSRGTAKRFKPFMDLSSGGPLKTALAKVQAAVFGDGGGLQCHWQYEREVVGKRHQAKYVPRTFAEWAYLKLRPASYGLAHSKNRPVLVEALDTLGMKPLPEFGAVELRDGLAPAPLSGSGPTEKAATDDLVRQLHAHRAKCPHCAGRGFDYPEHRRTMTDGASARGSDPPEHGPPGPSPRASLENQRRWQQFLSLSA